MLLLKHNVGSNYAAGRILNFVACLLYFFEVERKAT